MEENLLPAVRRGGATRDGNIDLAEVNVMLDAVVGANGLAYRKLFDGTNGNTRMSARTLR